MYCSYCPFSKKVHPVDNTNRFSIENTNLEFSIDYEYKLDNTKASFFLKKGFQDILKTNQPKDIDHIYLHVYEEGCFIGTIYAQSVLVKGKEAFRLKNEGSQIKYQIQRWMLNNLKFRAFIVGNLLLTGNFGMNFKNKTVRESFVLVENVVSHAVKIIEKQKKQRFNLLFFKDYTEDETAQAGALSATNFHCFNAEPSMVMEIPEEWKSFDDYLNAMVSKYRRRAKQAFKRAKDIEIRDLNYEEIVNQEERIYELYKKVCDSVDFNLVTLHPQYFSSLKKQFSDEYHLTAYYLNGEMIGFHTTFHHDGITHSHFLGMDSNYTRSHDIYLNMLYQMVKQAIEAGSSELDFARTASEIKSSVGAMPQELYFFIKHRNPISNKLVKRVFKFLEPEKEMIYRNPFGKNTSQVKSDSKSMEEKLTVGAK